MDNTTVQPFQAHLSPEYERYHTSLYLPDYVLQAAEDFLPIGGVELPLSNFYWRKREERKLPRSLRMPREYRVIDVTVVKETKAVYRVSLRFPWSPRHLLITKQYDMQMVLEGDGEVLTAYFVKTSREVGKYVEEGEYETRPMLEDVFKPSEEELAGHCTPCQGACRFDSGMAVSAELGHLPREEQEEILKGHLPFL